MKSLRNGVLAWLSLVACALVLNACGGGSGGSGGSGGDSAGASSVTSSSSCGTGCGGTAMGTVNGFGSVIVDGQEFQETPATVYRTEARGAPEALAADGVRLGQRVIVSFDANGNITLVDVIPEVEGTVSSITSSVMIGSGTSAATVPAITAGGVLVTANTDLTQGPVTSYGGGYMGWSSIQSGDNVEVHGLLRSANGVDYVQATFIGKQPSFVGTRITGIVANYNAADNTFTLGTAPNIVTINAAGATVLPSGSDISNNAVVSVWSNGTISGNTLSAGVISVRSGLGVAGETLAVSGPITNYVSQANFMVNGVTVDASAVTLPMGVSALSNGMMVVVSGTVNSGGALVANQLRVFGSQTDTTPPVVLQGDISDFVSASNFTVRGVVVDASQNPSFNAGFSAANLQDGAYVKITGKLTNNVVVATSVDFTTMPGNPVLDLKATVQSYVSATGALTLTLQMPGSSQSETVTVTLANTVTFNNGSSAMLTAGQKVKIHAIYDATSNTFAISTITFMPPPSAGNGGGNGSGNGDGNTVLLAGVVTATNPGIGTATSFMLHGLTIDIGSANVINAPGVSGGIAAGDLVAVVAQTTSTGDVLDANAILVAPAPPDGD